ncbi:hypothetical protein BJY00DRAFT_309828 [Aspergillus carlsbadensis]|nr:hypothetical protein BJY00DRAFT_309828 [Aspergillus carlsbadensis]
MTRYDLDAADHELMLDGLDCPDDTVHTLCCPAGHGTACGWYTHHNGKCDSACPQTSSSPLQARSGEIGSVRAGLCHKEYQSTCCIVDQPGTKAYLQLQWAQYPNFDDGGCGDKYNKTLVVSTTGSGDALCNPREDRDGYQERKLCYDASEGNISWNNCRCHPWLGLRPEDSSDFLLQLSLSRVAAVHLHFLVDILIKLLTVDAVYTAVQQRHVDNWNAWVKAQGYANLVIDSLKECVKTTIDWYEIRKEFMEDLVCRLDAFSSMCEDEEPSICNAELCAPENFPELCEDPDELEDGEDDTTAEDEEEEDATSLQIRARQRVSLMSKSKTYQVQCPSGADVTGLKIHPLKYRRAGAWDRYSPQFTGARQYQSPQDCANPYIYPSIKSLPRMATEHILELQTIVLFFQHATEKRLASGGVPSFSRIDCSFFTADINRNLLPLRELYPKDPGRRARDRRPGFRIMGALGSEDNDQHFYILEAEVNGMKSLIFGNKGIIAATEWRNMKDDTSNPAVALHYIKATIAVWHYLLDPQVKDSWIKIAHNLHSVFKAIDASRYQGVSTFVDAWEEWYVDWVNYHLRRTKEFLEMAIKDMNDVWALQPNSKTKTSVKGSLRASRRHHAILRKFAYPMDPRTSAIGPKTAHRFVLVAQVYGQYIRSSAPVQAGLLPRTFPQANNNLLPPATCHQEAMAVLPPEIWAQISLCLEKRDISALSCTSRYYYEIATPFLYRSLRIQFRDPDTLRNAVNQVLSENRQLFIKYARTLHIVCLKPLSLDTEKSHYLWSLKDWEMEFVHWEEPATIHNGFLYPQLRSSTCVRGLGIPRNELGRYHSREWVRDWTPIVELIGHLSRLEEVSFAADETPFEPVLFKAITAHHPACRVNIWSLQAVEQILAPSNGGNEARFDFNALQSEAIRTLAVKLNRKYSDERGYEDLEEMLPFLFLAPNLIHLVIAASRSTRWDIEKSRREWASASRAIQPVPVASLESLTLLDNAYPTYVLPKLSGIVDLSNLRSLDITLDFDVYLFTDLAPSLVSLERLFAGVSTPRLLDISPADSATDSPQAMAAVLAVKPLKYLCLRGLRDTANLHRILEYHGATLRGLGLEPYVRDHSCGPEEGWYKYPKIAASNLIRMAKACPDLAELRLQIRRSEGNAQECDIYRALGHFPRLRTLILDLHFDPREGDPDAEAVRRMYPNQFDSDDDDDDDDDDEEEEEEEEDDKTDYRALFRTTLINAATDATLARAIWDLIAASQPSGCLQNLRIAPFGQEMYAPDESYFLIFLARSFLVSRVGLADPAVEEIGRMAWTVWQEDTYGPGEDCVLPRGGDEVVAGLWPALAGREDWSTGWASFPLEVGG